MYTVLSYQICHFFDFVTTLSKLYLNRFFRQLGPSCQMMIRLHGRGRVDIA